MECSCEINSGDSGYGDWIKYSTKTITSKTDHICSECGTKIKSGTEYQRFYGTWEDDEGQKEKYLNKTCLDCLSLKKAFFGDSVLGQLWEDFKDHMESCGWMVPEKCLSKVTPCVRAKICEWIEEYWKDMEEE